MANHTWSGRWLRPLLVMIAALLLASGTTIDASAARAVRQSGASTATGTERSSVPAGGDRLIRHSGDLAPESYQPSVTAPNAPAASAPPSSGACRDHEEWEMLSLINQYRAANGLPALQMTQTLSNAAEFHSADMAAGNYVGHTLSNGSSWSENMNAFGYGFETYHAENIAAGHATALETFRQWVNSPGHNANILNPDASAIGIGRATSGTSDFGFYWTATFGGVVDGGAC